MAATPKLRYEFGPDVITLESCPAHEVGAFYGSARSSHRVYLNGILRAHLAFPAGYGGKWTLVACWPDDPKFSYNIYKREAAAKGEEGKVQALEALLEDTRRFPTEIEAKMRAAAQRVRNQEKAWSDDPTWGAERTRRQQARVVRDGLAAIARREAAEDHAAVLETISAAGLSNRQAAAIDDARAHARRIVEAIHDVEGEARRRREFAEKRAVIQSGRGVKQPDTPIWWPGEDPDMWT